jgi:hypothetical protein
MASSVEFATTSSDICLASSMCDVDPLFDECLCVCKPRVVHAEGLLALAQLHTAQLMRFLLLLLVLRIVVLLDDTEPLGVHDEPREAMRAPLCRQSGVRLQPTSTAAFCCQAARAHCERATRQLAISKNAPA